MRIASPTKVGRAAPPNAVRRSVAALGFVAALASCNQIWGNEPVVRWDAPTGEGPPEAALPTARLELLVATTDTNGAATTMVEMRALEPAPTVQIGRVDGALIPATYDGGAIEIPADFPGAPWRLVYTLPGDVPHEVHWAPAAGTEGRAVVAQLGGVDRGPVPANASYRLQPANAPAQYTDLRVYTTGVWAVGTPSAAGSTATQPVNAPALQVVSGPLLAPDPAKGDRVILANYAGTFPCQATAGAAVFRIALTGANSTETPPPGYIADASGIAVGGDTFASRSRLATHFGVQATDVVSHAIYGVGASAVAPGFVTRPFGSPLWGPAMIPFVRCIGRDIFGTDAFSVPDLGTAVLPTMAHVQLLLQRSLPGGAVLYSGLSSNVANSAQTSFALTFPAGFPSNIKLGTTSLATDRVALTDASPTLALTFELDTADADYATATLYRVSGSTLVRDRVYTFTGTSLAIDRTVFATQAEYVIELRTFTGAPGAAAGDFTRYLPTQSSSTRFTSSFVTP